MPTYWSAAKSFRWPSRSPRCAWPSSRNANTRAGPDGRAIGVDMTDAMVARASKSAVESGLLQVEIRKGDATFLPVADDSIDVIISNGVLNLVPEKERGFAEIVRVLKPGGPLHLADIALDP